MLKERETSSVDSIYFIDQAQISEFKKDSLEREIREKVSETQENTPFLMEGISGFSPSRMVARYVLLHQEMSQSGYTEEEISDSFSQMVETDLKAYACEFLYRSPILQTQYEVRQINGVNAVVQPKYDPNSSLHTHVSLKERDGASFRGVVNLETAILEARNHTSVIYISPSGENGTGLPFPESQVHIVNIIDNEIIDTTIRNSLTLNEITSLYKKLADIDFQMTEQYPLIKEVAETVISFPRDITPEELLAKMRLVHPSDPFWNRMKIVGKHVTLDKTFSYEQIKNIIKKDDFLKTSTDVNEIIEGISEYLKNHSGLDEQSVIEMTVEIGKAALLVAESIGVEVGEIEEKTSQNGNFGAATRFASESLGCETPTSEKSLQSLYDKEGVSGKCTECGDQTKVICGWCIKCSKAGKNYRLVEKPVEINIEPSEVYGSLLVSIIKGLFS